MADDERSGSGDPQQPDAAAEGTDAPAEGQTGDGAANGEPSFLKGAAKIATLGAVVGAAFGAARAMTKEGPDDGAADRDRAESGESPETGDRAEPSAATHDRAGDDEETEEPEPRETAVAERRAPDEDDDGDEEPREAPDDTEADARPQDSGPDGDAEEHGQPEEGAAEEPERERRRDGAAAQGDTDAAPSHDGGGGGMKVIRRAKEQLAEVTGRTPEAVLGLEKRDDGWLVTLEVLELARIPNSTDVLAAYEAHLDPDGELLEYARTRRYHRGRTGDEEGR